MSQAANNALESLLQTMTALRDPETGCPWDRKQTFDSIVPYTLEEAYEVAEAIELKDWSAIKEELGDLLFQIVFYCQLGKEAGKFDFQGVMEGLNQKLVARHPHVFDDANLSTDEEIKANWEKTKQVERDQKMAAKSVLADVPLALPALSRAEKIQKRCATVGFDWKTLGPVVDKVKEELDEVLEEVILEPQIPERIAEEVGDLLFATVNLSRHLGVKPEQALSDANRKFERRFRQVESNVLQNVNSLRLCTLNELESEWQKVKQQEKNDSSC